MPMRHGGLSARNQLEEPVNGIGLVAIHHTKNLAVSFQE